MAVPSPSREKPDAAFRAVRQEQDSSSETSSVQSVDIPERRDLDILTQVMSTRSEEYRLLFRLPSDEVLIQDFNCALQDNILLQGHMYLFLHHICFYSNIFGFETKRTIAYHDVTAVKKAKMAAIFPTAIEIYVGEKRHFFGSFLSRDEAYRLIIDGWAQHSNDGKAFLDRQVSTKSDGNCQDGSVANGEKEAGLVQTNGFKNPDSVLMSCKNVEIQENGQLIADCSNSDIPFSWQVEDIDAPTVPECFTLVAEAKFQICTEDFFKLFFSDSAVDFVENFHKTCGDREFQCSQWHHHSEFGHARDVSFQHPIKIYFGAKCGSCQEIQKFRVYRNGHVVIQTSQQINDVPYGDYFHVQGLWHVENLGENSCNMRTYTHVAFSRKTMWKGKIEQSTIDECRDVYQIWINNAHDLLKQKNLERDDSIAEVKIDRNQDAGLKSLSSLDQHENIHIARSNMAPPDSPPAEGNLPAQEKSKFVSIMSTFSKELLTNFSSSLRSQTNSSLLMGLVFVFILMQLSIIILLMRPPRTYIIPEGNFFNGQSNERSEITDWVEKRVHRLSEEMSRMETRLEMMRQEHSLLKLHLQAVNQIKPNPGYS